MKSVVVLIVTLMLVPHLHAGLVHVWAIREIRDAPLLAVATVEAVAKKQPVPPDRTRSKLPEQYWEATLRVHRSYSRQPLTVGARVTVRYVSYGELSVGGVSGYPHWPLFETGQTAVFALAPGENGLWRLVADEGST